MVRIVYGKIIHWTGIYISKDTNMKYRIYRLNMTQFTAGAITKLSKWEINRSEKENTNNFQKKTSIRLSQYILYMEENGK